MNMDALDIFGRTRDVTMVGLGEVDARRSARAAREVAGAGREGRSVPGEGAASTARITSRFAKIGVPAAYVDGGTDYVGRPPGWGKQVNEAWTEKHYHQPSDEYRDDWDLSGMVEDVRLIFFLAAQVADAPQMPTWHKGDEFEAARTRALRAAAGAGAP